MVAVTALWLPILLSAVFVFFVSYFVHMVLPYHRSDFARVPKEDDVAAALRPFAIPPGDYMLPRGTGPESMKDPKFLEKMKQGPVFVMTMMPAGSFDLGPALLQWFAYSLLVGVFAAYVAGRALGAGTPYLAVFRFAGVVAFTGYGLALIQDSIWYRKAWSTTLKNLFDALLYGLITAGTFGWLWPR